MMMGDRKLFLQSIVLGRTLTPTRRCREERRSLRTFTMSKSPDTPNLQNSVKRLKTLSKNLFNKSPKEVGEVYLAAVGLLVHLTKDQATIHSQRYVFRRNAGLFSVLVAVLPHTMSKSQFTKRTKPCKLPIRRGNPCDICGIVWWNTLWGTCAMSEFRCFRGWGGTVRFRNYPPRPQARLEHLGWEHEQQGVETNAFSNAKQNNCNGQSQNCPQNANLQASRPSGYNLVHILRVHWPLARSSGWSVCSWLLRTKNMGRWFWLRASGAKHLHEYDQ